MDARTSFHASSVISNGFETAHSAPADSAAVDKSVDPTETRTTIGVGRVLISSLMVEIAS
jgi:hypothetical protein